MEKRKNYHLLSSCSAEVIPSFTNWRNLYGKQKLLKNFQFEISCYRVYSAKFGEPSNRVRRNLLISFIEESLSSFEASHWKVYNSIETFLITIFTCKPLNFLNWMYAEHFSIKLASYFMFHYKDDKVRFIKRNLEVNDFQELKVRVEPLLQSHTKKITIVTCKQFISYMYFLQRK